MSKWRQIPHPSAGTLVPAGTIMFERKTRHCVIHVRPKFNDKNRPTQWDTRCADQPRLVDLPDRPDRMDAGYEKHVGVASSIAAAKSAASRSAERAEARRKKLKPDHADIESIARDAEKQARAIVKADPAAAKRLREKARTIREEKFAGRRRKVRR